LQTGKHNEYELVQKVYVTSINSDENQMIKK